MFILFLCAANALNLISRQSAEQFLTSIYESIREHPDFDQTKGFSALEDFKSLTNQEAYEESENQAFLHELDQQLIHLSEVKINETRHISNLITDFLMYEIPSMQDYLKSMIRDKEKMIEQDNHELDKLRKLKQKTVNRLAEVQQLIADIEVALDQNESATYYKILEAIESKAVVGLFESNIDEYMLMIDQIFKHKNFKEDHIQIVNLISIVRNILFDTLIQMQFKMQQEQLEEFDVLHFFENNRATHVKAKEYFEQQLKNLQNNVIQIWQQLKSKNQQILEDNVEFLQWLQDFSIQSQNQLSDLIMKVNAKYKLLDSIESNFVIQSKRF